MAKLNAYKIGWIIVAVFVLFNCALLFKIARPKFSDKPLQNLDIKKPTLFVLIQEFECRDCLTRLLELNQVYHEVKENGRIAIKGIVFSESKTDSKNVAKIFAFPTIITDDFTIFKRLNITRTPLLLGISRDHQIFYFEVIPDGLTLTKEYLKKGALGKLYFADLTNNQ